MEGIIYKYTNIINGKSYIGQTIDEKSRIKKHKNSKDNLPFHCAIRKYGWENFKYEVLVRIESEDKLTISLLLDDLEIYYISKYNTLEEGYNLTSGGSIPQNKKEGNKILQILPSGEIYARYDNAIDASNKCGLGLSPDVIRYRCSHVNSPTFGLGLADKNFIWMKEKDFNEGIISFPITIPKRSSNISIRKSVLKIKNGTREVLSRYVSVIEASIDLKCSDTVIRDCCNGKIRTALGYDWWWEEEFLSGKSKKNTPPPLKENPHRHSSVIKPIIQLDKYNNFIKKWDACVDAVRFLMGKEGEKGKVSTSRLVHCLKTKELYYNFRWMYEEDYIKNPPEILDPIIIQCLDNCNNIVKEYDDFESIYEDYKESTKSKKSVFIYSLKQAIKKNLLFRNHKWKIKENINNK